MTSRFKTKYQEIAVPSLMEKFGIKNKMAVPKILKVSVNIGVNSKKTEANYMETLENTIKRITGQKPIRTKAKIAISAFKVKENMVVGMAVTLRGVKMYDFLDKLVNISIPRIRDFRGLDEKSVDKQGNLSIGFKEHVVFPEIHSDEIDRIHGLQVTITTNANNYNHGLELFRLLGFPFKKS